MKPEFNKIKAHYAKHAPVILKAQPNEWAIDPYAWEYEAAIKLTPIERDVWSDIRALGFVFYPQCPVGPYFVDFGNPVAKVAIECDGAAFHRDEQRDAKRQAEIEAKGWTVYRLTGSQCRENSDMREDENGIHRWNVSHASRMLQDIAANHPVRLAEVSPW